MTEPLNDGSLTVEDFRSRIDAIDVAIASLLSERANISHQIQDARIRSGGTRTDLGREREVITAYVDQLGHPGSDIAHSVLVFCRGRANAADYERQG